MVVVAFSRFVIVFVFFFVLRHGSCLEEVVMRKFWLLISMLSPFVTAAVATEFLHLGIACDCCYCRSLTP